MVLKVCTCDVCGEEFVLEGQAVEDAEQLFCPYCGEAEVSLNPATEDEGEEGEEEHGEEVQDTGPYTGPTSRRRRHPPYRGTR